MNNPQQPREYDAVLGGNSPSLEGAAVLGGIEGVKLRLKNPHSSVRIAALEQALNYGEQGLDLVIAGLNDESVEVQEAAYLLLKPRTEVKVKLVLIVVEPVELQSSVGIDYSHLRDLLAAKKWKEADQETRRVILAVAKKEKKGFLLVKDISNFPCEDLRTIDKLWIKYSNGRFGFSVQKRIYESLVEQYKNRYYGWKSFLVDYEWGGDIFRAFGDKVGWRRESFWKSFWTFGWLSENDVNFEITAPEGHLPVFGFEMVICDSMKNGFNCQEQRWISFSSLSSRIEICKI